MLVSERQFSLVWCLAENAHRPARRQKAQAIHGPTATDKGDHLLLFFLISLRERERETLICCSTYYTCIGCFFVYAPTGIKPVTLVYQDELPGQGSRSTLNFLH